MKIILINIFVLLVANSIAQTFTNNTVAIANSWNSTLSKTINVSGVTSPLGSGNSQLVQVNVHMGRQTDGTYNFSYYSVRITSPSGTTATIANGQGYAGSWTFPNGTVNEFNCKFRDNQYLQFPSGGSGSGSEPWHIGYYRTLNANALSVFNGENPNGNWTVTIIETSASNGARFNETDLVFAPALLTTDYTSNNSNNDCATPYCLRSNEVIIGTNSGFTSQGGDMYNPNTTGCSWNAAQNNSAWFKFVPSSTNVHITISGITGNLQILAVSSSGSQCTASNNAILSGGCPTDAINDTYKSPRYTNGSLNNNQLNLSGLTVGQNYFFIVDGTGGSISPFYIEITGADNGCSDILPVEFSKVSVYCKNQMINVNWQTYSEINNELFTVQISEDGVNFSDAEFVPGAGTSNSINNYSVSIPTNSSKINYCRIRQTDFDGNSANSEVVAVNCTLQGEKLIIYPTLFSEILELENNSDVPVKYVISDTYGRQVVTGVVDPGHEKINTSGLSKGTYVVSVPALLQTTLIFRE